MRLSPARRWYDVETLIPLAMRLRVRRLLAFAGCVGVIALSLLALPTRAGDAAGPMMGDVVKGIIGYTRWPTALVPMRFCFVGEVSRRPEIEQAVAALAPSGAIVFSQRAGLEASLTGCDVAYVVAPDLRAGSSESLALSAKGVLTIGEGEALCSLGTCFCLTEQSGEVAFATNLDAIARSGLKVNPRVLKLSQQLRSAQP